MKDSTSSLLAMNVKRLRERRGLTQQELSEASGIPRPTIANLESGTANPTLAVVLRVASALAVTVEELVASVAPQAVIHPARALPEKRRTGAAIRRLIPEGSRPAEFERLELAPGAHLGARAEAPGTREYLACESGDIELVYAGDVLRLGSGDVAALVADQPRDYANRGRRAAVAYRIVMAIPVGS